MLLNEVRNEIQNQGYFVGTWDIIEEAHDIDIETRTGLNEFKEILSKVEIDFLPKIINGSVANLEKSIIAVSVVFFNQSKELDKSQPNIKYALLVGKIAAIMAKVDGCVNEEEISKIRENVYKFSFLSESEKYQVFIRSVYALSQKSTKEELMREFSVLSPKAKKQALTIAKDIAIADHYIDKNERLFLYELYRLAGLPTNTVAKDLREHAKNKNIVLEAHHTAQSENMPELIIEIDDSFDQMLTEFESF